MEVGVPQGSVLGPLLFLLNIFDMYKCSSKFEFVFFADDTRIFIEGDNVDELYDTVNEELIHVDRWLRANKLSLNLSKTS
jgi:hypothetical protein